MQQRPEIYTAFYGLRGRPFHVTADPRSLFLSDGHKEALAAVVHGIRSGKGFIVVTGEVGIGKTTVLRAALAHLGSDRLKVIHIPYPKISVAELLQQIGQSLGEPAGGGVDVVRIMELLIEEYRQETTVVVVIDEAQRVAADVLESLRLLSNFETDDDKLVQTVLVGQPELETLLAQHDMRPFRSRVAFWVRFRPLTRRESLEYIRHRLHQVGSEPRKLFSSSALAFIVRQARGFPRSINIYCDNALVTGFGYQAKIVSRAIVREALAGFGDAPQEGWLRRRLLLGSSMLGGVAALALAAFSMTQHHDGSLLADAPAAAAAVAPTASPAVLTQTSSVQPSAQAAGQPSIAPPRAAPPTLPPNPPPASAAAPKAASGGEPRAGTTVAPAHRAVEDAARRVVVHRGDTLGNLALRIYGKSSKDIIARVTQRNRHLTHPDQLQVGQVLVFPALGDAPAIGNEADATTPNASGTNGSAQ